MAGHSQFKNIMYRKGAQDAKRAKVFAKLIRELTVAAKEGGVDPNGNPRLKTAIASAKASNLPKDTMERAIKRGGGESGASSFESIRYEGYATGGVALIVETLTNNRNRTASEVRSSFSKYGGTLAETNSVTFQFVRKGSIRYYSDKGSADQMLEIAIEANADEVISIGGTHEFLCSVENFFDIKAVLEEKLSSPSAAEIIWKPSNLVQVDEKQALKIFKLIEALDDCDDVQSVSSNFEVSDEILKKLSS